MKVKVVKTFIDRETLVRMDEGMSAEYSAERARSLIEKGFVEKVEKEETEKKEKKTKKTTKKK